MTRTYGQYCGLARALDVVGDRWNLLIVRQLLTGPARYRDLLDGLPGVATNLLADRLRDLETAGVVERQIAEEGNSITYALTTWGTELREPIESLIRWSSPLMVRGPGGDGFRSEWLLVALPALLSGRPRARGARAVGILADGELIAVRIARRSVAVDWHDGHDLDAVVSGDPAVILGLAAGMLEFPQVRGLIEVDGDEGAVRELFGRGHPDSATPAP